MDSSETDFDPDIRRVGLDTLDTSFAKVAFGGKKLEHRLFFLSAYLHFKDNMEWICLQLVLTQ
jgi:hypothetical protein